MVPTDYVYELIVMIIILLIIWHVVLAAVNLQKNREIRGIGKEIEIVDSLDELKGKVKICYNENKIILDNIGFEYKEKIKSNMFFLFKGVVVPGYIGDNQDTGEYIIEISPDTNTKTITSRGFTAPPAKEEDLNSIRFRDEETLLFGFITPDKACENFIKKGVAVKEFSESSCRLIIMRTFFMIGKVTNCGS